MTTKPRVDYAGAFHHVVNMAPNNEKLFCAPAEINIAIDIMEAVTNRHGTKIHGYAIMPNHFHLLVESVHGNLSTAMNTFTARLTKSVNQIRGRRGALFPTRFKSKLQTTEAQLAHSLAYIHMNPIVAGISQKPSGTGRTSHDHYWNSSGPSWLESSTIEHIFGTAYAYQEYLEGIPQELDTFTADFATQLDIGNHPLPVLGSIENTNKRQRIKPLTPAKAISEVMKVTKAKKREILQPTHGRKGNAARRLAAWWLLERTQKPRTVVADSLNMTSSAVGRAASVTRHDQSEQTQAWKAALRGL